MKISLEKFLTRITIISVTTGVIAIMWDSWWHLAIGRDSFFIPPHLLLYSSVTLAFFSAFYGLWKLKKSSWKILFFILLIIPLSAPFDQLWHSIYGIEDFSSPLIIWSPPHLIGILSALISLIILLSLIHRDKDKIAERFFASIIFASIISLLLLITLPFYPTGPYQLLEFYGSGIVAFVIFSCLLYAKSWLSTIGTATMVSIFTITILSIGPMFEKNISPSAIIPPYGHIPNWLFVFALLISSLIIDLFKKPLWLIGSLSATLWGITLFGFSSQFLEPLFKYTYLNAIQAIISSSLGGLLAGLLIFFINKIKKSKKSR